MKAITWVAEPLLFENHAEVLRAALPDSDRLVLTDLDLDNVPLPKLDGTIIVHGSLQLAKKVKSETQWNPGVICNLPNFLWLTYAHHFKEKLLNPNWDVTDTQSLIDIASQDKLEPCFVRPNDGGKAFHGTPICGSRVLFLAIAKSFQRDAKGSVTAIVSPLQTILSEYRMVVINRKVVTGCRYILDDCLDMSPEYPKEAADLAQWVADQDFQPDSAYVVDVAQTPTGYKVIELNAFSTADWYACDVGKIITAIHEFLD